MVLTDPRGLPFFSWAVAAKSDGDQDQSSPELQDGCRGHGAHSPARRVVRK
jgi:hypothetical protein